MNQKTTKRRRKQSQLKNAVITSILDLFLIVLFVYFMFSRWQEHNNPKIEAYTPVAIALEIIVPIIILFVLLGFFIYSADISSNTEKDDELSKLHKYKAGNISNTITTILFALVVYFIRDFSFAFLGDFIQNWGLPLLIITISSLITNITFIILEKFQLD
jgi:heme/copper-type cytochrome/quinol oxidase subunit 2